MALYGLGKRQTKRWTMTERGRGRLQRDPQHLGIGPSRLVWENDALTIHIDETTAPIPTRIRGVVRLRPAAMEARTYDLDADGRHRWRPIAPCATIEVALERPALTWSGPGYFDSNAGDEPLENGFSRWTWSRAPLRHGTSILYDAQPRGGPALALALRFDPCGGVTTFAPPPIVDLTKTPWRMARSTRCDPGFAAQARGTLEDSPFYARSLVATHLLGEPVTAMHESLSLDRFRTPWMQMMLPFRMPRAG